MMSHLFQLLRDIVKSMAVRISFLFLTCYSCNLKYALFHVNGYVVAQSEEAPAVMRTMLQDLDWHLQPEPTKLPV